VRNLSCEEEEKGETREKGAKRVALGMALM
jgi:hypothetical protein